MVLSVDMPGDRPGAEVPHRAAEGWPDPQPASDSATPQTNVATLETRRRVAKLQAEAESPCARFDCLHQLDVGGTRSGGGGLVVEL